MKRKNLVYFIAIIKLSAAYSQDVINPYLLRELGSINAQYEQVNIRVPNSFYLFESTPKEDVSKSGGYAGEYMISLQFNPWHGNYKAPTPYYYNDGLTEFGQYTKTYTTEIVSFPFTINCYDGLNGCADPPGTTTPTPRDLFMPDASHPYNPIANYWESSLPASGTTNPAPLRNIHEHLCFNSQSGMSAQNCPNNYAGKLVSNQFVSDVQLGTFTQPGQTGASLLPHTAIKHTVYLHCPITNDVVTQFSWIYDNTRGMMKCYPFLEHNLDGLGGAENWDVIFAPMLLMENVNNGQQVNSYNRQNNFDASTSEGMFPGGTIDYFPFTEITNNGCNTFPPPTLSEDFNQALYGQSGGLPYSYPYYLYKSVTSNISYPFFSPYILLSASLRNANGKDLAGYGPLSIDEMIPILHPSQRLWHQYHIDNNIDLSVINPTEKVIYNPSEVTVTANANNLQFPDGYTFKTTRGVYPTVAEVLADNTTDNGGYYNDLRQVPVRTDLRFDPNATRLPVPFLYPHNPAIPQNSVYASVYTMESGSKITVGNCTRIFDATFKVNAGATLIFKDHSQTCGAEDMSTALGRYKIIGNGGAILRNYDLTQYVQNGIITQDLSATPYIAQNTIEAGDNTGINPDTDQPTGTYDIQAGGDVSFVAGDYIHLTNGFQVSGGNFSAKTVGTVPMPDMCYYQQIQGGGNRFASSTAASKNISVFNVTPNPGNGMFNLTVNALDDKALLFVDDVFGKNMLQQKISNYKTQLDLTHLPKGVYFVKYFCYNTMKSKKVVIQ